MDFNNEFLSLSGHTGTFDCIIKRVSIHDEGVDLEHVGPLLDYLVCFLGYMCAHQGTNGEVARVRVHKKQSRESVACGACRSQACTHRLSVNGSGILRERLLFAYGALRNETWGLGNGSIKSPGLSHTRWDGNDGGEPLAEGNH